MQPIDLNSIDLAALIKIAITIACALGLKDLAAKLGHQLADAILKHVKKSETKLDDAPGALLAALIRHASDAALKGDLTKLAQVVTDAFNVAPLPKKKR